MGTLWEEGHFLPGVFLFSLPNRKLAPEEAEMLPFDPPRTRPSLTTALRAASPGPRRTCHPQTQSRAAGAGGSPRLRGTSSPSVERGPCSRPRLRARPLLRMSARRGSGLPLHCPGENQRLGWGDSHSPQGWKILQAWSTLPLCSQLSRPLVHRGGGGQQKCPLWLP